MSIETFIKSICVQTAVYWGNPQSDGEGGLTFDDPIEIKCRWEESAFIESEKRESRIESDAEVMTMVDLEKGGVLYLGKLYDWMEAGEMPAYVDPRTIQNTYEIKQFNKVPMIKSTTVFVRTSYLKKNIS